MPSACDNCVFFNDTATTEIYTLSLHDALPIPEPLRVPDLLDGLQLREVVPAAHGPQAGLEAAGRHAPISQPPLRDRKSTRLNSSHANISYAVFCLKKKSYSLSYESPADHR